MDTIRNEIATCLERAYPSLPISDCQILLFFPPQDSAGFKSFAETRHWKVTGNGHITFPPPPAPSTISSSTDENMSEIPASMVGVGGLGALYTVGGEKILKFGLRYAGELEKVI